MSIDDPCMWQDGPVTAEFEHLKGKVFDDMASVRAGARPGPCVRIAR